MLVPPGPLRMVVSVALDDPVVPAAVSEPEPVDEPLPAVVVVPPEPAGAAVVGGGLATSTVASVEGVERTPLSSVAPRRMAKTR